MTHTQEKNVPLQIHYLIEYVMFHPTKECIVGHI